MEEAKAAKEEAAKLRAELQAELAKARTEAQAVRDEARRDAERLRDEIAAKAKADMQAERERLRRDMDTATRSGLASTVGADGAAGDDDRGQGGQAADHH